MKFKKKQAFLISFFKSKKNISIIILLVLFFAIPLTITTSTHKQLTQEDASTPSHLIYYGVHVPGWLNSLSNLTTFENDANKKVSIVMWYQGWGLTDGTQNFETSWMDNIRNHGSIPMVTWEPWLYTNGINQPQYSLINIINGNFDAYIKHWADDSKAWGKPYFLRFAEEMNGNWFPWGESVNGNKPGQFVQAWKHVHGIFSSEGVTNVTWVWSPNVEYNGSTSLSELYPGDSYVDWLGMDGYNWGLVSHIATSPHGAQNNFLPATITGWQSFSQVFSQTYTDISALSLKPLMVSETASAEQGGNKANWITDAYGTQIPNNFTQIKAINWFNENKETDWRIESSSTSQAAFAAVIQSNIYTANNYGLINSSPIPPPSALISPTALPSPTQNPTPTPTNAVSPTPTPSYVCANNNNCSYISMCQTNNQICYCQDRKNHGHDKVYKCIQGKWTKQTGETNTLYCSGFCN